MKESIDNLVNLMAERYSFDISFYCNTFLEKIAEKRISETSTGHLTAYLSFLEKYASEAYMLLGSLNNCYSEFFRDQMTFYVLEHKIFPEIFTRNDNTRHEEVRIWSAGCSSGQEPYSLAIIADDYRNNHKHGIPFRIFATDKSEKELQTARKGIYHASTLQNTTMMYLNKYFSNSGEFFLINETIKSLVDYSVYDLLDNNAIAPPASIYGDFNIIMCSNLLFYYKQDVQEMLLNKLFSSLLSGGFLITGETEAAIIKSFRGLRLCSGSESVFKKA